jgi:U3 small nucleolar RNA-associated protein 3
MSDEVEDGEDEVDEENDIEALVNKLPLEMRRKILSKNAPISEDEESEDEEEDEDEKNRWGKKKNYWNADTADVEDVEDLDDAREEEVATKELFQAKLKRMQQKDFYDDLDNEEEDNSDDVDADSQNGNTLGAKLQQTKQAQSKSKNSKQSIDFLAGSEADADVFGSKSKAKDVSKLSKAEKLEILKSHAPELIAMVDELKERISELQNRISPLREYLQNMKDEKVEGIQDDLVDYLDVKQQLLFAYITNVTFYLYMKSLGKSVRSHPVMGQLLRLRYAMEKLQTIDQKVKYQIDRLVKLAEMNTSAQDFQKSLMRPNLAAMDLDDDEDDEEENHGRNQSKQSKQISSKKNKRANADSEEDMDLDDEDDEDHQEVYRAAKNMAQHYPNNDNERADNKHAKKLAKQKDKLRHSELVAALRDEFSDAPEVSGSGGIDREVGDAKRLAEEASERQQFEEDHFVRLQLTRKDKQAMKRRERDATRLDNFDDIGDFADLEALGDLSNSTTALRKTANNNAGDNLSASKVSSSQALERAFQALGAGKSMPAAEDSDDDDYGGNDYDDDDDDDDMGGYDAREASSHKRRRAPEAEDDADLDQNDGAVFDDFLAKKAKFQEKKKAHYQPEARYGGFVESVGEDDKRAASYEIIKNKGLTPHRKKLNRNPRVKKREKYADAVVRRKGQVRDVITGAAASYDGEKTGIKANVARSRKM